MITPENKVPILWLVGHDVSPIFPVSALATPCSDWTFSCSVPYILLSVAPFFLGKPRSSPTSYRTFCVPLLPTAPHAPIIPECMSPEYSRRLDLCSLTKGLSCSSLSSVTCTVPDT